MGGREWSTVSSSVAGLVRDVVVPIVGVVLIVAESRRTGVPRWELVVLYAGMIGLPGATFLDWRQRPAPPEVPPAPPSPALPPPGPSSGGTP